MRYYVLQNALNVAGVSTVKQGLEIIPVEGKTVVIGGVVGNNPILATLLSAAGAHSPEVLSIKVSRSALLVGESPRKEEVRNL